MPLIAISRSIKRLFGGTIVSKNNFHAGSKELFCSWPTLRPLRIRQSIWVSHDRYIIHVSVVCQQYCPHATLQYAEDDHCTAPWPLVYSSMLTIRRLAYSQLQRKNDSSHNSFQSIRPSSLLRPIKLPCLANTGPEQQWQFLNQSMEFLHPLGAPST